MSADVWIEAKACESCGVEYDCTRPTEHQAGVHRLIRHYRRTSVPVVVGVAS